MNLDHLYKQLGLDRPEVLAKAKEYLRMLALRMPSGLGAVRRALQGRAEHKGCSAATAALLLTPC